MSLKKKLIFIVSPVVVGLIALLCVMCRNRLNGGLSDEDPEIYLQTDIFEPTNETTQKANLLKMNVVSESMTHAIFFRESDALVGVYDKKSGEMFFSHPYDADDDTGATAYYRSLMKADLIVTYCNEYVQSSEENSYTSCVADSRFETKYLDNGIKITYTIGETATKRLLPQAITIERFEYFLSLMDEKAQKKVKRNYLLLDKDTLKKADFESYLESYSGLSDHNMYILKDGTKDYLKDEIEEYFVAAGYTEEDCLADIEQNMGEAASNKPWFIVPVTYTLEEDSFVVTVLSKEITYNSDGYYLTNIDVLPYFGAETSSDDGYMFVPDGSGALIYLNNTETTVGMYSATVYGTDETLNFMNTYESDIDESRTIKLPVYGIKNENHAWLSVIEGGDGYAKIMADIAGKTTSYNHVYAAFSYMSSGSISLGDIIGANSFNMYSEPQTKENWKLRIFTLSGEKANYSGMAVRYREYLESTTGFKKTVTSDTTPLYAEYIGAIKKTVSTLGIKHETVVTLTSFEEADKINALLSDNGVTRIKNVYLGIMKGGLKSNAASNLKIEKKLSRGNMNFSEFLDKCTEDGIKVFPMADLLMVYDNTVTDGYGVQVNSPRYFDRTIVRAGTGTVNNGYIADRNINLISPYFAISVSENVSKNIKKTGVASFGISGIGNTLYSDFDSDSYADRQDAIAAYETAFKNLSNVFTDGLLTENANAYALSYVTDIVDVPFSSNGMRLIDKDVPFYEIVIKGYREFAGEALNLADDYKTALLKTVETGAGLCFKLIYADNSVLKETDYDNFYSVNYENWIGDIARDWEKAARVNQGLNDKTILHHDEYLTDVFVTTYENGARVAVNYGKTDVTVDGVTVKALDFERIN